MPGLLKIGFTLKDPSIRARELEQTGVPHPFVVDYEVMVENPRNLEQLIHKKLEHVRERKEWFRCNLSEAVEAIRMLVGNTGLLENLRIDTTQHKINTKANREPKTSNKPRSAAPAHARLRSTATFTGQCKYCQTSFTVTVTRHESGATCPSCHRYNPLPDFINRELPR